MLGWTLLQHRMGTLGNSFNSSPMKGTAALFQGILETQRFNSTVLKLSIIFHPFVRVSRNSFFKVTQEIHIPQQQMGTGRALHWNIRTLFSFSNAISSLKLSPLISHLTSQRVSFSWFYLQLCTNIVPVVWK